MKYSVSICQARWAALALSLLAGSASAQAPTVRVDSLAWMQGCWGLTTDSGRYEELWLAPTGNSMLGISRRIEDGQTRDFEFMQIATDGRGGIDYIAQPVGELPTRYRLTLQQPGQAVFENPAERFPRQLRYEAAEGGQLTIHVEGSDQGESRHLTFSMSRKDCH